MSDAGVMRSAVLMLALGEDEAAEVMKYLGPKEVQKLGAAMATMKSVGRDQVETALSDFMLEAEQNSSFGLDSDEYIRSVLTKALGDDKASNLLNRILQSRDASGIESLKWMDAHSAVSYTHLDVYKRQPIFSEITLHLPQLGKVSARICVADGRVQVNLLTENAQTLETFKIERQQLFVAMTENGQSVEALTVGRYE